ncbi:MAG: EAL domain-containing protein, partial [Glaciecola sp.]
AASHIAEKSLVEFTDEVLRKHNITANCLRYEITESALIDDGERARFVMEQLSKLGVKIALDDFGTGFSSLSYLRQFPVDIVKIDRTFVMGIAESNADRAIITATIALAKALNMECIAEGVETSNEEKYLNSLMCHYIQGYLYHKPMPIDALQALLKHQIPSSQ